MDTQKIMRNYLRPAMVEKFGKASPDLTANIEVCCYNRGMYKVCPNPDDAKRVQSAEEQFCKKTYISKQSYYLTKQQFQDPSFWDF